MSFIVSELAPNFYKLSPSAYAISSTFFPNNTKIIYSLGIFKSTQALDKWVALLHLNKIKSEKNYFTLLTSVLWILEII